MKRLNTKRSNSTKLALTYKKNPNETNWTNLYNTLFPLINKICYKYSSEDYYHNWEQNETYNNLIEESKVILHSIILKNDWDKKKGQITTYLTMILGQKLRLYLKINKSGMHSVETTNLYISNNGTNNYFKDISPENIEKAAINELEKQNEDEIITNIVKTFSKQDLKYFNSWKKKPESVSSKIINNIKLKIRNYIKKHPDIINKY